MALHPALIAFPVPFGGAGEVGWSDDAARCTGHRSVLHRASQRVAQAHAAHCQDRPGRLHLHTYVVQAECSMAPLTVEVSVLVIVCMMVVTGAQLVAKCTAAVLYAVYQVVLKEERERAEDGASLGVGHPLLHFLERERALAALQLAIDKQSHGGGLHAHLLHPLF